jgi:hypothetical protein
VRSAGLLPGRGLRNGAGHGRSRRLRGWLGAGIGGTFCTAGTQTNQPHDREKQCFFHVFVQEKVGVCFINLLKVKTFCYKTKLSFFNYANYNFLYK